MSEGDQFLYTCRACLQLSTDVYPIFQNISELNSSIASILELLLLEIKEDISFPDVICNSCFETIQIWHNFIQTFRKSQLTLVEQVNTNWEVIVTPDETQVFNLSENCSKETIVKHDDSLDSQTKMSIKKQGTVVETPTYLCPSCGKSFTKFKIFSNHITTHSSTIHCQLCPLVLEPADFSTHYKTVHRYQCEICSKSFTRNTNLQRHLTEHSNTLSVFVCPVADCWKTFSVKSSLKRHTITVHSNESNFLCNKCGVSFKNNDSWRYHMKKHSGGTHLCMYCGRTFIQAAHLTYHLWRHTGVKPYNCRCGKSFVSKKLKTKHLKDCEQNNSVS